MLKELVKNHTTLQQRLLLRHLYCQIRYAGDLRSMARFWGTDKEGVHFYAQHYQRHFAEMRKRRITILEIGIGGYSDPKAGGESLRMWKSFFPKAQVVGLDISDKSAHQTSRIKTFCGSQTDTEFLERVIREIGQPDIIIDDGSHLNQDVIQSFSILFPKLKEGGFYCIEDLQTSYWTEVNGQKWDGSEDLNAEGTSVNFLKSLIDCLNYEEFMDPEYKPTYFDRHIVAIHFYHNLAIIKKGTNAEGSNILGKRA